MSIINGGNLQFPRDKSLGRLSKLDDVVFPHSRDSRAWSVVYTREGKEKALANVLRGKRIPFYLPMLPCHANAAIEPLFERCMFLFGAETEHLSALGSGLTCRILPVSEHERLQSDLINLHRLHVANIPVTRETDMVHSRAGWQRVNGGKLSGLTGLVLRGPPLRLYVGIDCLKKGVSIPIDSSCIQLEAVTR